MALDPYQALTTALEDIGLTGQRQSEQQLIVSSQVGPVWPNRGNSFWVSHKQGTWYLSTWAPVGYRVPATQDILKLCAECMLVGTSAMSRVPPEIISRFELQELDYATYDRLFGT